MQNHNPKANNLQSRTFQFSLNILQLTSTLPNKPPYWTLTDQLVRSATSIGANIIEARASSSKREFIHFFEIALKSANETEYWLKLLKESKLTSNSTLDSLISEILEISRMLGASILTMKNKRRL